MYETDAAGLALTEAMPVGERGDGGAERADQANDNGPSCRRIPRVTATFAGEPVEHHGGCPAAQRHIRQHDMQRMAEGITMQSTGDSVAA